MRSRIITVALVSSILTVLTGNVAGANGSRPVNDDLAAATAISEVPFTQTASLSGASLEPDEVSPSCKSLRGSVWYRLESGVARRLSVQLSSTFPAALAAYRVDPAGLSEVTCTSTGASNMLEFDVASGEAFLLQVGNIRSRTGTYDLDIRPARWQEKVIHEITQEHRSEEKKLGLLEIHGAPRAGDPSMYDVSIRIAEQIAVDRGILTFGLVQQPVDARLVDLPGSVSSVAVRISTRYDSTQYSCLSDQGEGGACDVNSPLKDLSSFANDGSKAELVIRISAMRDGAVVAERTVAIPFAGQAGGVLP